MRIINFPLPKNEDAPVIMGCHQIPSEFFTFDKSQMMGKIIHGKLDAFNFPIIEVIVSNPNNNKQAKAIAVIDTGAAHCLMQPDLIKALELNLAYSSDYLHPQNGIMSSGNYFINVLFDTENEGGCMIKGLRVAEIHAKDYPAALIIGIEFLQHCDFTFKGSTKTFELVLNL